jgi:large subunit ribosomal protein L24
MAKVKLKIRRNDTVMVIAGKHKGRTGKVIEVFPTEGRVVVEGIALVKRHVKPQQDRPGSIIEKERPIHISNVALWDAAEGRRVKVGFKTDENGVKIRIDRKTGAAA